MLSARLARWALPALLTVVTSGVGAQATTTSLGTYIICRTTPGAAACFELGLTTAARLNNNGARNGTTGVVRVQSLQGAAVAGPDGSTIAASNAITVLRDISFFTPGCLPGQACGPGDYFTGMPFNSTIAATTTTTASGSVAGTLGQWQGTAELYNSGESILRFSAPGRFRNPNSVLDGLGGCTAGEVTTTDFVNFIASASTRTCDAQGATGALEMAFTTNAIFDPTYFWSANIRFYGELIGRPGIAAPFYCGVGANRRGEILQGGMGQTCNGFAAPEPGNPQPGVVPEPSSVVLLASGIFGLVAVARRRRRQSV